MLIHSDAGTWAAFTRMDVSLQRRAATNNPAFWVLHLRRTQVCADACTCMDGSKCSAALLQAILGGRVVVGAQK